MDFAPDRDAPTVRVAAAPAARRFGVALPVDPALLVVDARPDDELLRVDVRFRELLADAERERAPDLAGARSVSSSAS
ncbi:MAG: hypothetical protein QOC67_2370, partial [Pseudonocardiales bacterium]|nr:hypothetical protein [Pseudonocardiales bacterium]